MYYLQNTLQLELSNEVARYVEGARQEFKQRSLSARPPRLELFNQHLLALGAVLDQRRR